MNKFLELEKRFEKIMEGIENLPLNPANVENPSQKKDQIAENLLSADESSRLSNRIKELEKAAKTDSEQIDKLIAELRFLLEKENDRS